MKGEDKEVELYLFLPPPLRGRWHEVPEGDFAYKINLLKSTFFASAPTCSTT
jgi:hypothetical protein